MKGASPKSSHSLLLVVACAVLVPAAALAVLQYRTLTSLEVETPIAVRESLRQTIRAYDRALDERVEEMTGQALGALLNMDWEAASREDLAGALRVLMQDAEGVDQISVARLCDCPNRLAAVVSSTEAWVETRTRADAWPLRRYLERARPVLPPKQSRGRSAFLHIEIEREPEHAGLYAFQRSGDLIASVRLSRRTLLRLVDETTQRRIEESASEADDPDGGEPSTGAPEFHLVHETSGVPINARSPHFGYELREALGEPITGWALAAFYPDRSLSEMTRESLRYNLALMTAVLLTLFLGVALSLGAVARQAKLAEMKSTFVSNVSHEMRTPLALISLYAETLEMGRIDDPEKVHEYHSTIHRESKRLDQMVNNVLDFSRIESGRRDYRLLPCNVNELLDEVVAGYYAPITAAGFKFEVEIEDDLPLVLADRDAISQAILNLLDNAVKYSPAEKSIALRASRRDGDVAIELEDRGIGIAPGDQSKVFEKFHRAGNPLTPTTRGSGLGLALAKHAVEAHGGRIRLRSAVGQGSCFMILLPVAQTQPVRDKGGPVALPDLGG